MYQSLPTSKSSTYSNGPRAATYAVHGHQAIPGAPDPEIDRNAPKQVSLCLKDIKPDATPPAADAQPKSMASAAALPPAVPWSGWPTATTGWRPTKVIERHLPGRTYWRGDETTPLDRRSSWKEECERELTQ